MKLNYKVATGVIVKEYLDEKLISIDEIVSLYKADKKYLEKFFKGKNELTDEIASMLEMIIPEISASYWRKLDREYQSFIKKKQVLLPYTKEEMKEISQRFKFKEVFKGLRWDINKQAIEMLKILNINNFEEFDSKYQNLSINFFEDGGEKEAIAIWINLCKEEIDIQNDDIDNIEFNMDKLNENISLFKGIANNKNLDNSIKSCRKLCNELGIYFVERKAITNCKVRGALLTYNEHPAIFISRRFKTHDQIWFTIAHELGHLIKHYKKGEISISMENDESDDSLKESEANEFARNLFISDNDYNDFVKRGDFSDKTITLFAIKNGVQPGILVGRLQHDKYITMDKYNYRKSK